MNTVMKRSFAFRSGLAAVLFAVLAALLVLSAPSAPLQRAAAAAGKNASADEIKKKIQGLPPKEQVARLRELLEGTPDDAHINFYLGNAYLALDLADSAAAAYEKAVEADSTYTKAHVNLGIALEDLNRFEDARLHYEKALGIDSTDVLAHCHLGHYYHTRGDLDEAVDHYTRAIGINPKSAQAHYNLGLAFADTRLFAEAIREWETVIELSPKSELGRTASENLQLIKTYVGEESSQDPE